ncbi:alpha/beta fold hydrolase [Pseudarthrobacter sulfonivorans]|uniref:esterase/lipase family protein n=1 Tax=Pseudarthrobacter sulfonivorans TaxID=121292 RepID=UPI00285822BB|nr:alpha/beta fold hydrolase [Pseudarthrobacter sulfonivorans]MDR6413500.1 pimeloyl-ACP methyl ester carboxylesterase [Pseudarthrobacter sulfonivorans]
MEARAAAKKGMLVYVPSINWRPSHSQELLDRLEDDGWQVHIFEHNKRTYSLYRAEDLVQKLCVHMRAWSGENHGDDRPGNIVMVGHSLGGLLVRDALMSDDDDASIAQRGMLPGATPWTDRVSRVVLIASPNAGYDFHSEPWFRKWLYVLASLFGQFMVEQFEMGSPYMTELRLRWYKYMVRRSGDDNNRSRRAIRLVQVFGDEDRLVSSRANEVDPTVLTNAAVITIPGASHGNIIKLKSADSHDRYELLYNAVNGDFRNMAIPATPEAQEPVVFILHGARSSSYGNWVSGSARLLKNPAPGHDRTWMKATIVTESYGYFGIFNFVNPWIRRRNARRLLLSYGEKFITHNPNNMYFLGHSNGTYMLGRCLEKVPSMRFRRIYLAATVLPKEYEWKKIFARQQVGHFSSGKWVNGDVHCDRGRHDVPVGWLCSILHGLTKDIGTGGFEGFLESPQGLKEHNYGYAGGHSSMLLPKVSAGERSAATERRLTEIAAFIRHGHDHTEPTSGPPNVLFALASRVLGEVSQPWSLAFLVVIALSISSGAAWYLPVVLASVYAVVTLARAA